MPLLKMISITHLIIWTLLGVSFLLLGFFDHEDKSFVGLVISPVFISLAALSYKSFKLHSKNIGRSLFFLFVPTLMMVICFLLVMFQFLFAESSSIKINGVVVTVLFPLLSVLYFKLLWQNFRPSVKTYGKWWFCFYQIYFRWIAVITPKSCKCVNYVTPAGII